MERAIEPALVEVAAGGDDLPFQRVGVLAGQFAQIGREPGPDQPLECGIRGRADDFDLEIATASRPPGMVGRGAGGDGAGVDALEVIGKHRERTARVWQVAVHQLAGLHHRELIPAQPSGLHCGLSRRRDVVEAVCAAAQTAGRLAAPGAVEVPTSNMERGVHEELASGPAEIAEAEAFGVAEQPSRLVIAGPIIAVE